MSEPVAVVRIPLDYESDPSTGLNRGRAHVDVPVKYEPDLPTLGERRINAFGPCPIVLREPNEQVLLHEILHVILDGHVSTDDSDPHGHRAVSRVEVALWEAGYRRQREPAPADQPCERCVFIPTPDGKCICREVGK